MSPTYQVGLERVGVCRARSRVRNTRVGVDTLVAAESKIFLVQRHMMTWSFYSSKAV